MTTTLPTTPGSIIGWHEKLDDNESFYAIATLVPGHIDETTGEVDRAVWAASYLEDHDDEGNVYTEEHLVKHEIEVLVEGIPAAEAPERVRAVQDDFYQVPGTVVRFYDEEAGCFMTYAFVPGFYDAEDEHAHFHDCMFINSYGGFARYEEIEAQIPHLEVVFVPSKSLA